MEIVDPDCYDAPEYWYIIKKTLTYSPLYNEIVKLYYNYDIHNFGYNIFKIKKPSAIERTYYLTSIVKIIDFDNIKVDVSDLLTNKKIMCISHIDYIYINSTGTYNDEKIYLGCLKRYLIDNHIINIPIKYSKYDSDSESVD